MPNGNWWQRYIQEQFARFPLVPVSPLDLLAIPTGTTLPVLAPPELPAPTPTPTTPLIAQPPPQLRQPTTQPQLTMPPTTPPSPPGGVKLPKIPTIDEFLQNVTPIRPVPPRSPQEEALSEYMKTPEFVKGLAAFMLFNPERGAQVLAMLQQFFPRAFPTLEEEYKRKWIEAERERYASERQQAISEYNVRYKAVMDELSRLQEEESRRFGTLLDAAGRITSLNDFITVERMARNLRPEQYQHVKGILVNNLTTRLLTLPPHEARNQLARLHAEGVINDDDLRYINQQIENNFIAVQSKIRLAKMQRERLAMYKDRLNAIGRKADAEYIQGIISEIDSAITDFERTGVTSEDFMKLLDNLINRSVQEINRVVTNTATGIVVDINKLINVSYNLRRGILMSDDNFINMFRAIKSTYTDLPPQVGRVLTDTAGSQAAQSIERKVALLRDLAESLEAYIKNIPDEFWTQDYRLAGVKEQVQTEIRNLREVAAQLEGHKQDTTKAYETLRATFDEVAQQWVPTTVANRIKLSLQRQGVSLRADALALAREKFNFSKWIAKENLELRRRLVERGDVLGGINALTKLFTLGASLMRLSAGAGTLDNDYMKLLGMFSRLAQVEDDIEKTLANELLMTEEQRSALQQTLGEIRKHRQAIGAMLERHKNAKTSTEKEEWRRRIMEYSDTLLQEIFKGLGETALADDLLYGVNELLDFMRAPGVASKVGATAQKPARSTAPSPTTPRSQTAPSQQRRTGTAPSFREQIFGGRR